MVGGEVAVVSSGTRGSVCFWSLSLFSALLVLASATAPAAAGFKKDQKLCNNRDTKPFVGIAACTRQIRSRRLKEHDLAIAYYNRGTFGFDEIEYGKAIADYKSL